ncbi:GNAT family N-acetyltransferase [Microbacterium sp. ZW T5_45]|uniref:GNAT family N-acetyltransferase n=1 Tax=Microbacterium sp. ZW T5_45 TaxID=3378080 RepID=UPI003851D69D
MAADTRTERLILTPIDSADPELVQALFEIQSDPATWTHLPDGVETDVAQSRAMAEDYARSWRDFGLGWWAIRTADRLGELAPGAIIGLGGAAVRRPDVRAWNLGYRLARDAWGHGFATEVGIAARRAAAAARPDLPVTARALTRNPASWRTLERVGLNLAWEGDDPADYPLTSGLLRRVYADREVPPELLAQLIALG